MELKFILILIKNKKAMKKVAVKTVKFKQM